jgi:EAL domain-containing protein (putative c-di-GMP-specific phosphodiesterase class I)
MKGFRLSMDDFGTGYSTLLELVRLPFNEIKIDPRFIDQVGVRRESGIVIRSAIGLAHGLGMTVCAEGVENAETLEFLRGADCDAAQGRHIHEPVSGADLMAYLKTRGKDAVREPGPIRASGI